MAQKELPYFHQEITGIGFTMQVYFDFVNKRIRVDDYRGNIVPILTRTKKLAMEHNFTKIIIKSRYENWRYILSRGFELEGVIDHYFNGNDAYFMVYYLCDKRRESDKWKDEDDLMESVLQLPTIVQLHEIPPDYTIRIASVEDSEELVRLYCQVFDSYPTPMSDVEYIQKVIEEGTIFYIASWNKQIVSAAAAEVNTSYNNAEITDCATLPNHRKHGFVQVLITKLEQELLNRKIFCSYSLARAQSYGMNAVFKKLGYKYNGRLTNNCIMNHEFEDMNVWVKSLM